MLKLKGSSFTIKILQHTSFFSRTSTTQSSSFISSLISSKVFVLSSSRAQLSLFSDSSSINLKYNSFSTSIVVLKVNLNTVPTPNSEYTLTVPYIYSMMCLQIERPRPVPSLLTCLPSSYRWNARNKFFSPSFGIPIP